MTISTPARERPHWPTTAQTWPADEYMAWSHGAPDKHAALRQLAETEHADEGRRAAGGEEGQ